MAGTVGRVENLVVEDGEVEGQAEADGMRGGEVGLGDVGGVLQRSVWYCDHGSSAITL